MMKINKLLTHLALAALLAACSSEDGLDTENIDIGFHLGNSDVEVKLSAGGRTTRASIENANANLFDIKGKDKLGIFMLATHKRGVNATEDDIDWTASKSGAEQWSVWIDNDSAYAEKDVDAGITNITWAKTGQKYYYPIGNWYNYRFYGYYPRVKTENIEYYTDSICVNFTGLDGTKDVIWGRSLGCDTAQASSEDTKCRYSAQYFRKAGFSTAYPSLALDHKMMRLQFYVQGVPDEDADPGLEYEKANEMMVDTIEVINVPTTARLTIANRNTDMEHDSINGRIYYDWTNNLDSIGILGKADGTKPDSAFYKAESRINNDDLIPIGQPMLLPVPDSIANVSPIVASHPEWAGKYRYQVRVNLKNAVTGQIFRAERPLDLVVPNKFEHSKTYKVVLKIAGPKQVYMHATLAPWKNAPDDAIKDLIFN